MTNAEAIARALHARGVRWAFGMPGGETLPLIEALGRVGIEFVLVRHEAAAGFMAAACAELTGAPGACVSTLGPGATNLLSGVAGAHLERDAIVALTGQVAQSQWATYTHQTIDQLALFRPVTRHAVTLTTEAWREVTVALRQLDVGRPGPVLINIPADIATMQAVGRFADAFAPAQQSVGSEGIRAAAECLRQARRPVVLVGHADLSDGASSALRAFARALRAPVLTSYRAKGMVDEAADPWSAGAFGLSPVVDRLQQALIERADLLVTVGLDPVELRQDWLPGWRQDLPMVCIDRSPPTDLLHPAEHLLIAHPLAGTQEALAAHVAGRGSSTWTHDEVAAHRASCAATFDDGPDGPAAAIRAMQEALPQGAVVAVDVGAHRITASHTWHCREPRTLLQSNGFSSMAVGLPMGIAARLCIPDRPVAVLTGDMGLLMCLGELGIAQERGLDLVVVVLCDASLSLIELKQERLRLPLEAVRFANPDFELVAQAFGGRGVRVRGAAAVREAVAQAIAEGGLRIVAVEIEPAGYRRQM